MKIRLKKNHRFYGYVGKEGVGAFEAACADYECFSPHNWRYTRSDGSTANDFRCNYREHNGCPEGEEKGKNINKIRGGDMGRSVNKVPLIIAVFEQNIVNSKRQVDFAVANKDYSRALVAQSKVESATELLEVVKALGLKKDEV